MSELREDLGRVIELMVDGPDQVEVEEVRQGSSTSLELSVAEQDLGKVIGRQGRTARALRTVLASRAAKESGEIELKVLD